MTDASPPLPAEAPDEIEGGFSRRALGWIIGAVAVSFLAAVLLGVYGADLEQRPNPGTNTFSHSALGHRALVEFLRSVGVGVFSRQSPAGGEIGPQRPLIVAEPDFDEVDPVRLQALRDEAKAHAAPLVVVLPKWRPRERRKDRPGWLAEVDLRYENEVQQRLRSWSFSGLQELDIRRFRRTRRCTAVWLPGEPAVELAVDLEPAQLVREPLPGLEPLVTCGGGVLVARRPAREESPLLVVIADPDILNNHGLGRAQNAVVFHQLLTRSLGAEGAVFDETVHGFNRTPGLLAEALRFPMSLGVVQSLILLGIVLWAGMGRFGKPLPAPAGLAAGKEILIDNTAKLLAAGGHASDSLERYFRQTERAVAAHYFLPPDLPDGERLAKLQRLTDARGGRLNLARWEQGIRRLPGGRRGGERAQKMAKRLHQWRVEMANGNRESP